jgi:chromosomal replication initiator protein
LTASDREVVAALEQAIVRRTGEPRYNLWFRGHTKFAWEGDLLQVGVPNLHFQDWLEKTFSDDVRAAAQEVLGRPMRVCFAIDPELFQAARRQQATVAEQQAPLAPAPEARPAPAEERRPAAQPRRSRRWHRLSEFVVGPCNRVGHASALSVIEAPGQGPNPLVLYGPVGTGKTHLLEGIYAGLRKARPDWRVLYTTAEDFTNRFVQGLRLGKLAAVRKHFRECDALLLDDLHFVARKAATEEEFLHTFDALQAEGRQVVVTCDCHPKVAEEFTPEVTDRLLGGAVWGLTPPDAGTRLDILRARALRDGVAAADEVLGFLAGQLRGNVRELEGALHSLRHYAHVTGRPIDLALAREALADLLRHAVRVVQLGDVDRAVCRVLRLEAGALQAKGRAWAVSHPRMLAMFLARKHTAAAYSEIGAYFGGRNHSTVVAAEKKVRRWLGEEGELVLGERRLRARDVLEMVERELAR